jgi:2-dehydro-3-deoxyphosphooctonate aldolase (KDO 8-P synthase)
VSNSFKVGNVAVGGNEPCVLIAGPCVIESRDGAYKTAEAIQKIAASVGIPFVFKASYDKANRTSVESFRGPGIAKGLEILLEIKEKLGVPVLSDVHSVPEMELAAEVLDVLQIPAFLCRQTDLLVSAGQTGKAVSIKKGQFLAPWDMKSVVAKVQSTGNQRILLTERGSTFGYNTLVTDFRSLAILRDLGYPVVLDASHSVQKPGGLGSATGGDNQHIPLLARCGVAAGCDALFMETHPNPEQALSDGPNMLPLSRLEKVLLEVRKIDEIVRS